MSKRKRNIIRRYVWQDIEIMDKEEVAQWIADIQAEHPGMSEYDARCIACDMNTEYMWDEFANIDKALPENIICIANLGLWNGTHHGYKDLGNNLQDCFSVLTQTDYCDLYVEPDGNLKGRGFHHDGVNWYTFRMWRPGITDRQKDNFRNKILNGTDTSADIKHYTVRIGDIVGDIYGWKFANRPA